MRVSFHFGQKSGAEAQVLVLESALSICDRRPSIAERQMQTLRLSGGAWMAVG